MADMTAIEAIRWLAESERLGSRLERALGGRSGLEVCAAISCAGMRSVVTAQGKGTVARSEGAERVAIGCLNKGLTAALVAQSAADGAFSLDTPLPHLLEGSPEADTSVFRGVTVRQLLNHTHGIDLSALRSLPQTPQGLIDLAGLCRAAAQAPRLSDPGELHSYGDTGAWLAAALLERLRGAPYEEILGSWLRSHGVQPRFDSAYAQPVCPSRGNGLNLSAGDLLTLLERFCDEDPTRALGRGLVPGTPVPLPGWSLEHGCALGWKYYGDGWFGHNALLPLSSVVVRFNIAARLAILLSAGDPSAAALLARVFGRILPEFRDLQIPRPLPPEHCPTAARQVPPGVYANGETRAVVTAADGSSPSITLQAIGHDGDPHGSPITSSLQPCTYDTFMLDSGAVDFARWVQFVRAPATRTRYLWNGKVLLRSCG